MTHKNVDLTVPVLTRVEGEGAMHVSVSDGRVSDVRLEIYEPPRFFEGLLVGRDYSEPPDVTARICGICPVAYQMSACHAIERACGVSVTGQLRALRRLLYCGEWIESHVLHIGLLHAPDFLGYPSGIAIAEDHPDMVELVLQTKKVGNRLLEIIGGRSVHPVNVRLGGFHRLPDPTELQALLPDLHTARDRCVDLVRWTGGFDFPDIEIDAEFVSLRHPDEYPFNEGRVVSDRGLDIDVAEFEQHFIEEQVAHSTALHARRPDGRFYHVGPLARWANNFDRLPSPIRDLAADVGADGIVRNPYRSIVVRGLEVLFAIEDAIGIITNYEPPQHPWIEIPRRAGVGWAATEAPRGLLYHRYEIDDAGAIRKATIVPPTSQNQPGIEHDLRAFVEANLHLSADELELECEKAIRNYDPCISCATHFLQLTVDRA